MACDSTVARCDTDDNFSLNLQNVRYSTYILSLGNHIHDIEHFIFSWVGGFKSYFTFRLNVWKVKYNSPVRQIFKSVKVRFMWNLEVKLKYKFYSPTITEKIILIYHILVMRQICGWWLHLQLNLELIVLLFQAI